MQHGSKPQRILRITLIAAASFSTMTAAYSVQILADDSNLQPAKTQDAIDSAGSTNTQAHDRGADGAGASGAGASGAGFVSMPELQHWNAPEAGSTALPTDRSTDEPLPDPAAGPPLIPPAPAIVPQQGDLPWLPPGPAAQGYNDGGVDQVIQIPAPEEDGDKQKDKRLSFRQLLNSRYSVYREERDTLGWIPASGEHLSWLDWQSDSYLERDESAGVTSAFNIHWIGGPTTPDVPSRVYDFHLGMQFRDQLSSALSYDIATSVGVFSDFEGSAREGVRFPSHAVGMFHVNHSLDVVFGVDYLGRDDIHVLPVIGISLRDIISDNLRMDLVFPRPRIDYNLSDSNRVYLTGQLGGGTWDMEYPDESDDVLTYRDYRLLLGFESADEDGSLSALELGFVFGRHLEFRNQSDPLNFGDTFIIQWVRRH